MKRGRSSVIRVLGRAVVRSRGRGAFWKSVPPWARAAFFAGVFCSFSVVGFVNDIFALGARSPGHLAFLVISSGLIAVAYAAAALRSLGFLPAAVALHVVVTVVTNTYAPPHEVRAALDAAGLEALRARLTVDGIGCLAAMILSYALFVVFISTEGQRYLRVHTEMVLAERIHRSLVPAVDTRISGFEFCGQSFPSGQVGGDLVDLVSAGGGWVALVADVSGHGVSSGVLTAMVKSAVRMRLRSGSDLSSLLHELNETLVPVIEPNMFVTCACLAGTPTGGVTLATAGHPPVLHYRHATRDIVRRMTENVALGLFPVQTYTTAPIEVDRDDVVVLLTDGLLEVFDERDAEFGLDGVSNVLRAHAREPLAAIAVHIREAALAHGSQMDDQTLLLVRAT